MAGYELVRDGGIDILPWQDIYPHCDEEDPEECTRAVGSEPSTYGMWHPSKMSLPFTSVTGAVQLWLSVDQVSLQDTRKYTSDADAEFSMR